MLYHFMFIYFKKRQNESLGLEVCILVNFGRKEGIKMRARQVISGVLLALDVYA